MPPPREPRANQKLRPSLSLTLQLFAFVILPLTALLIAVAIGSLYLHVQAMRDLVGERDERAARAAAAALDEQLAHRGFFVTLNHSVMGPTPYDGHATRFSATPPAWRRAGPALGEHTMEVLEGLLGYEADEIATLAISGALT